MPVIDTTDEQPIDALLWQEAELQLSAPRVEEPPMAQQRPWKAPPPPRPMVRGSLKGAIASVGSIDEVLEALDTEEEAAACIDLPADALTASIRMPEVPVPVAAKPLAIVHPVTLHEPTWWERVTAFIARWAGPRA